jgi:hypothetical protein
MIEFGCCWLGLGVAGRGCALRSMHVLADFARVEISGSVGTITIGDLWLILFRHRIASRGLSQRFLLAR